MQIEVAGTYKDCQLLDLEGKTAVVIDVLRATTVIATALYHGATAIVPAESEKQARQIFDQYSTGKALLAGERNAMKIEGFHLGNSPLEYQRKNIAGQTIILSTTNGTRALKQSITAGETIAASFVNITAVANYLANKSNNIVIICSGTAGKFSLDDALCAGMLISLISDRCQVKTDDLGSLVLQFYGSETGNIADKLQNCFHLKYLQANGYQQDIDYCLQPDQLDVVPVLKDGKMQKL